MSIPDRLMVPYLRAWTEWTDAEIDEVSRRLEAKTLHPMDLKRILAGEAVAALNGVQAAMEARRGFTAQFSRRSFDDVESLPTLDLTELGIETVGAVLTGRLEFTPSLSAARRLARQNGLRLVLEGPVGQEIVVLDEDSVMAPLREVVTTALPAPGSGIVRAYIKAGRKVARIDGTSALAATESERHGWPDRLGWCGR